MIPVNFSPARAGLPRVSPPASALLRLHAQGATPAMIDQLLAEQPVPLIEGPVCTFLWRGEADWVGVEHRVVGLPLPLVMYRMRNTDLWHASIELPRGSRVEYRLLTRRGEHVESMLDPLNPRVATGPTSQMSVLHGDAYVSPDWAESDPVVAAGTLVELSIASQALKREARVTVYLPARLEERPDARYPLLVMHDGGDFLAYAGLGTVLDNLMHRQLMSDCVVALTHPQDRLHEYADSSAHSRFLTYELVPELEKTLPLRGASHARFLAGASFGGVAALAAAVRSPGFYGGLLLESASLRDSVPGGDRGRFKMFSPVVRFVNGLRAHPSPVTRRIFQTYGVFEPLAEPNRALTPVLQLMADEVRVVEGFDGHNWTLWRDRLLDGFSWLLAP